MSVPGIENSRAVGTFWLRLYMKDALIKSSGNLIFFSKQRKVQLNSKVILYDVCRIHNTYIRTLQIALSYSRVHIDIVPQNALSYYVGTI